MIVFKNVSKHFNNLYALKSINLSIDDNLTILGPSGSGKSTLIRLINGLEIPTSGEVYFNGFNVKDNLEVKRKIGMVFQNFNLFSNMNIMDNLIFAPCKALYKRKSDMIEKAKDLLQKFNITLNTSSSCIKLSGGQKQRVAICRSLMMDPEIILFDEPTSALDVESVRDFISIILKLKSQGVKIITVTHDVNFARAISDRIIFMESGKIIEDNSSENFFSHPISLRSKKFLENCSYG